MTHQQLRRPCFQPSSRCRPECGWNYYRRNLRETNYSILYGEFNWLIDGLCGEGLPAIDLSHDDLSRRQQRPEQHGRGVGRWQDGLGFDASFELLVQAFDGVGGSCAL